MAAPIRVSALLEIKGAPRALQGWGKANITGIANPTLQDVWRQLIVNIEGNPGGDRYTELPAQYKDPNEYTIELLRVGQPPNHGPPFTMATPYVDGQFPYLAFVYGPKGPGDPTPLEGGKRRRKVRRTRGRRSLSTRAASRGTRRY
jgi:hypothetical protein